MKRFLTILFASAMVLIMSAQPHRPQQHERFSPEKFQSALEQYIKQEVQLTSQDASKFFSVYKEMHQKQRPLFDRQKSLARAKPQDEEGCRKAIEELAIMPYRGREIPHVISKEEVNKRKS